MVRVNRRSDPLLTKLRPHLTYANVMATIGLFMVLGGSTYAATGGNFILGQANTATSTTSLSAGTTGPAFKATNTSTGTAGSFNVAAAHPPFSVNTATKVAKLNADTLDGKDSTAFLGATAKATDSELLDGLDSTAFVPNSSLVRITWDASNGAGYILPLGPFALQAFCGSGGSSLSLEVSTQAAGTVNWLFAEDSGQLHVSGAGLGAQSSTPLPFNYGGHLEGQVVLDSGGETFTVVLHTYYDNVNKICEMKGTAVRST